MKVLSADQMREVDRLTSERYGIPSLQLMENAATRVVETAESRLGPLASKRALVISGKGNNGGDGAAIARLLADRGALVELILLGRVEQTSGDARVNLERARELASKNVSLRFVEVDDPQQLRREVIEQAFDVCFDAMLGTGLARPAAGLFEEAISLLNQKASGSIVVAVDIPSGIGSDSGQVTGAAVRARLTVSFTAPKPGNVLPPACFYGGELVIAPIGSPDELIESSGSKLNLVEPALVREWLARSRRSAHANKGDVGKVLIVAGSRGKTGAACLAGEAAMRSGAGLVTVGTPASAQPLVVSRIISECMTELLPETPGGTLAAEAAKRVLQLAAERDVVAMGPGIGVDASTPELVREVVAGRACPLVLDADGLNCLSPWPPDLEGAPERPLILTPHPGEAGRLIGRPAAYVVENAVDVARSFARAHKLILVLKMSRTLVAAPDGEVYINPTGNAGMATGGAGDVLTGLIAGLLGQSLGDPLGAVVSAVYLHGLAGDFAAAQAGTRAMIASDITARLGDAFIEVGGGDERFSKQDS